MADTVELQYRSVAEMFLKRVAATPQARAFAHPAPDGGVAWLTWREVGDRATAVAAGLVDLGVRPEDRVAILSNTRLEWILADLGALCAGAATTTVYPTTEPEDAAYILRDSGASVLIAENPDQAAKITDADLPGLTAIAVVDGTGTDTAGDRTVLTLADLEARGRAVVAEQPALVERIVADF